VWVITGSFGSLAPPQPLIFVAQGWSSTAVVALKLKIPILTVYLNETLCCFLSPLVRNWPTNLQPTKNAFDQPLPQPGIVIVTGTIGFFRKLRAQLVDHPYVMWIGVQPVFGKPQLALGKGLQAIRVACRAEALEPVQFTHCQYRGATNAAHVIGFSGRVFLPPTKHRAHNSTLLEACSKNQVD
jgi:hypothetical protein